MPTVELFWVPAIVLTASFLATGAIRVAAIRTGLLDRPTLRSSHVAPTPRGGGLAIAVTFLGAVVWLGMQRALDIWTLLAVLAGGGAVAIVGFWDDRNSLPASWRLCVHIGAASVVVSCLAGVPLTSLAHWGVAGLWLERISLIVAIAWMINLFNFMDGIDGIAGCEAVFVAGAGGWLNGLLSGQAGISIAFLALAAAGLGFLAWNWPPAKIFSRLVRESAFGCAACGVDDLERHFPGRCHGYAVAAHAARRALVGTAQAPCLSTSVAALEIAPARHCIRGGNQHHLASSLGLVCSHASKRGYSICAGCDWANILARVHRSRRGERGLSFRSAGYLACWAKLKSPPRFRH
jgi:hypothetical protein